MPKAVSFSEYSLNDKTQIYNVHVFAGIADALVWKGGISNNHLLAHSIVNICAKNYQNRLMCVEVIVCYISVIF